MKTKKLLCLLLAIMILPMSFLFAGCDDNEFDNAITLEKVPLLNSHGQVEKQSYRLTGRSFKARDKIILKITNDSDHNLTNYNIITNAVYDSETNGFTAPSVQGFWDGDSNNIIEDYGSMEEYFEICVSTNNPDKYWATLYNGNQEKLANYRGAYGDIYDENEQDLVIKPGETYYLVVRFTTDIQVDFVIF